VPFPRPPRAVTFDCWSTLIYEVDPDQAQLVRIDALAQTARRLGADLPPERAAEALRAAWLQHWAEWREGRASGASEMARWALDRLGLRDGGAAEELEQRLGEASLTEEIHALEGAHETLERLAREGIRRALVCDTGFSPGRIVRQILDREGLLDLLEVTIFSDEAGVPKPNPRVFQAALEPFTVDPGEAVHVGDLRRTDVAGARGLGMGSVRIRWHHDDQSEIADADAVADSHEHLREILGLP
jgi:putative hydrolase of the HAD superfamily